jgi:hypothetical protein
LDTGDSSRELSDAQQECMSLRRLTRDGNGNDVPFRRSDYILFTFYLENLLPLLFPFYRPTVLQGGRAWILELMLSGPVMRQATLCQSSYFFSMVHTNPGRLGLCELVSSRNSDAFGMLRKSLQYIGSSDITEHLHGAARILVSIMQLQRFEIAVMRFDNCQSHLNAAVALFERLLETVGAAETSGPRLAFEAVLHHLGPSTHSLPTGSFEIPSAEQAAFSFSSTILIFDDIIASTRFFLTALTAR